MLKLHVLYKSFLFAGILSGFIRMNASDTLKVKKVRFFIEPKAVVSIPINKTTTFSGYDDDGGCIPSHGGYYTGNTVLQNKPIFNLGLSAGLSIKLNNHLFYELSLSYYHYSLFSKQTTTSWYLSGSPDMRSETDSYSASYNYIGLGNGISYRIKRFSLTNTLLFYQYITYKEASIWRDNIRNWQQSYVYSGNTISDGFSIVMMSEHKIGYSFLNNKIVPFLGVNFNWSSSFNTIYGKIQFKPVWLPFASVKINF